MSTQAAVRDFRGCKITVNELREVQVKAVWILQKFETVEQFELLMKGSACYLDISEEEKKDIQLRFYLEEAQVVSGGNKYVSLSCDVLGGDETESLIFSVGVVDLDESLCTKKKEKYKLFGDFQKYVTIQPDKEQAKVVLRNKFLRYAASAPTWDPNVKKVNMIESILRFGITVGLVKFTPADNPNMDKMQNRL